MRGSGVRIEEAQQQHNYNGNQKAVAQMTRAHMHARIGRRPSIAQDGATPAEAKVNAAARPQAVERGRSRGPNCSARVTERRRSTTRTGATT
eukprot:2551306-Pyramimonas_sp.AAC.1